MTPLIAVSKHAGPKTYINWLIILREKPHPSFITCFDPWPNWTRDRFVFYLIEGARFTEWCDHQPGEQQSTPKSFCKSETLYLPLGKCLRRCGKPVLGTWSTQDGISTIWYVFCNSRVSIWIFIGIICIDWSYHIHYKSCENRVDSPMVDGQISFTSCLMLCICRIRIIINHISCISES